MKLILLLLPVLLACRPKAIHQQNGKEMGESSFSQAAPGPRVLVYKTRRDYRNLVPVILSEDGSSIISYPHPADLKSGQRFSTPLVLSKGYLLDERGIGPNVAFLKFTYEEYAALKELPDLNVMYNWIVDKNPLEFMCDCGLRSGFSDIEKQLNDLIDRNKLLDNCKKIK